MSDQEMITFAGTVLVNNWKYILGGIVAMLSLGVTSSWWLAKTLHKKEIEVLKLELSHQKDRFNQFTSIVDQRVSLLKSEAESTRKAIEDKGAQTGDLPHLESKDTQNIQGYIYNRDTVEDNVAEQERYYNSQNEAEKFLAKTDGITDILEKVRSLAAAVAG